MSDVKELQTKDEKKKKKKIKENSIRTFKTFKISLKGNYFINKKVHKVEELKTNKSHLT